MFMIMRKELVLKMAHVYLCFSGNNWRRKLCLLVTLLNVTLFITTHNYSLPCYHGDFLMVLEESAMISFLIKYLPWLTSDYYRCIMTGDFKWSPISILLDLIMNKCNKAQLEVILPPKRPHLLQLLSVGGHVQGSTTSKKYM